MPQLDFSLRPLQPFGAELAGVDLQRVDDDTAQRLRQALSDHALLVFKNVHLKKAELLDFARVFGTLCDQGEAPGGFNYLSTVFPPGATPEGDWTLDAGKGELAFHLDHCFESEPLKAVMLYSLEAPPPGAGGDTLFSDTRIATQRLPERLRQRIEGLTVLHRAVNRNPRPEAVKPMMRRHPESGVPIMFFSHFHAIRIMELPEDESASLIEELGKYVVVPESIHRHVWEPHELVVWDNLALQHARTDFDPSQRRHMMRVQVGFP